MMPKRSFKKPEPTAAEVEIEQLKTQIAEQRGLVRDLTIVLENRNAEIGRLQIDVARLKQENSELASDLRLHLGYAERDKARLEALRAALKPFAEVTSRHEMSVADFPKRRVYPDAVGGKEIWAQTEPTEEMVWAVCPYLRRHLEESRCQHCPKFEDNGRGPMQRGCYAFADAVCRVVFAMQSRKAAR